MRATPGTISCSRVGSSAPECDILRKQCKVTGACGIVLIMTEKEFTKLLKSLGMPETMVYEFPKAKWHKAGGFTGKNTLVKVQDACKRTGFVQVNAYEHGGNGNDHFGSTTALAKDGVTVSFTATYGTLASDNYFSIHVSVNHQRTEI